MSGLVCPQPVQVVRRCLAELEPGQELVVTGDYPPAERTITRTCYRHGYHVAVTSHGTEDDETFTVRIRVTDASSLTTTVTEAER